MIADWWAARVGAPDSAVVLMLAMTRGDTAAARTRTHAAGLLIGPTLTVHAAGLGERTFAGGDHVIVQRNTYDRGALNGTRAVVTAVDPCGGAVTLRGDHGREIKFDARHLAEAASTTGTPPPAIRSRASPSTSRWCTAPMP